MAAPISFDLLRRNPAGRGLVALVAVLCSVGLLRAGLFVFYAGVSVPSPWPTAHLEGASVHFASRVQQGLVLYPDDTHFPYVANLMGPCGFWIVGGLGRLCDADISALYLIGRLVSLTCAVATAVFVGGYLTRRYGIVAGIVGAVFSLGAAPLIGYAVMTRPDMLADLAGIAGFFVACRAGRLRIVAAAVLLATACLTKQTAAVYVVAACLACALRGRDGLLRNALPLAALTTAFVLVPVGILSMTSEPHIVDCLLAQGSVPWAGEQCVAMLVYLMRKSPEIVWFSLLGGVLWTTGRYRNRELLVLAVILWLSAIATCGKRGSDLNYFLSLRIIAALAAGTLCAAVISAALAAYRKVRAVQDANAASVEPADSWPRPWLLGAMVSFSVLMMLPSIVALACSTRHVMAQRQMWRSGDADALFAERDRLATLAAHGDVSFLTDDDQLAVFQGERAALLDTYLFRLRADAGAVDLAPLVQRLQAGDFQYLVLSADVAQDYPDAFFWRLPKAVAEAVRQHYRLSESSGPWWVYVPEAAADKSLPDSAEQVQNDLTTAPGDLDLRWSGQRNGVSPGAPQ